MGLYLCVFDEDEEELEGVEVGSYDDYGHFVDAVVQVCEAGSRGSRFPVLTMHSDCDGEWSVEDCRQLQHHLKNIAAEFLAQQVPPFLDIEGEPLLDRLLELVNAALEAQRPILFQ